MTVLEQKGGAITTNAVNSRDLLLIVQKSSSLYSGKGSKFSLSPEKRG